VLALCYRSTGYPPRFLFIAFLLRAAAAAFSALVAIIHENDPVPWGDQTFYQVVILVELLFLGFALANVNVLIHGKEKGTCSDKA